MIAEPMEVRTKQGTFVLTVDNCCVCVFPENFKKYEHVFLSTMEGERVYFFDAKLVDRTRTKGFPLFWRPYPTEADRQAFSQRSLSSRELNEFIAQLADGVVWTELDDD